MKQPTIINIYGWNTGMFSILFLHKLGVVFQACTNDYLVSVVNIRSDALKTQLIQEILLEIRIPYSVGTLDIWFLVVHTSRKQIFCSHCDWNIRSNCIPHSKNPNKSQLSECKLWMCVVSGLIFSIVVCIYSS